LKINCRRKGNRTRHDCIEILTKDGWAVSIVERAGEFIKDKDLFGVGDVLALKKTINKETGRFDTLVKVIQCVSNRPHTHKMYDAFANRFPGILLEQWVRIDRRGWKIYRYWEACGYEMIRLE
jgi:hypothetical protein